MNLKDAHEALVETCLRVVVGQLKEKGIHGERLGTNGVEMYRFSNGSETDVLLHVLPNRNAFVTPSIEPYLVGGKTIFGREVESPRTMSREDMNVFVIRLRKAVLSALEHNQ